MDGTLVHRRVTPSSKFAGTHLYTWVERGTMRVKYLAQEHNAVPRPGLEPGPPDPESSTLIIRPPRLPRYVREVQKSRGIILDDRKRYISRSTQIFSLGLIRGIENSGLFTCMRRISGRSAHSSDLASQER